MTQPLPSATIEYERYVDGLRRVLTDAYLHGGGDLFIEEYGRLCFCPHFTRKGVVTRKSMMNPGNHATICNDLNAAIARVKEGIATAPSKTITVQVEGGLVQDVTGIPAGYEVRVEDYDEGDPSRQTWDDEKKFFVTVYGGDGV